MQQKHYQCAACGKALSYQTTKHTGCPECGFLPVHSAD